MLQFGMYNTLSCASFYLVRNTVLSKSHYSLKCESARSKGESAFRHLFPNIVNIDVKIGELY